MWTFLVELDRLVRLGIFLVPNNDNRPGRTFSSMFFPVCKILEQKFFLERIIWKIGQRFLKELNDEVQGYILEYVPPAGLTRRHGPIV